MTAEPPPRPERTPPEAPGRGRTATAHVIIGTAICLATVLVFAAFWSRLPASVPVQVTTDGTPGNHLPKAVVVFGFPLVSAALNLVVTARLRERLGSPAPVFYVVPALALVLCAATLVMALA